MSYSNNPPQQPKKSGWGRLIFVVLIVAALYSTFRYLVDKSNYSKAHQAYQQADCTLAISHFDRVINGWRLVDIGGYYALSQQEKAECLPLQAAVDKQQVGDFSMALAEYADFFTGNSSIILAEAVRDRITSLFEQAKPIELTSLDSCYRLDTLLDKELFPKRDVCLPPFYLACGQFYDTVDFEHESFAMYESLLTEYPNHSLAAEAEASLLANTVICEETYSLKNNSNIANRKDFMSTLYYSCGQVYEDDRDWVHAITMYENFLAEYPSHSLASDVETALARSIVAQSKAAGAGEILAPERSGSTDGGFSEVIIQNDSPERLRIVFSGPESHVEELDACSTCIIHTGISPPYCPEKGPIGRYMLEPGQYDVVVESISDRGTTSWTGVWSLINGDEYYSCFIIETTFGP